MPYPAPFPIDPALTAIAVNFRNPDVNFIADAVLPRVDVMSPEFKWTSYPVAEAFTVPQTLVSRKGAVEEVEFTGTEVTSSVNDYGLDDVIPQRDIDTAAELRAAGNTAFDPEARAIEALTHLVMLDREIRVANLVFAAATYDTGKKVVLSGASQFSDASSDPIGVINTALDATLIMRPNIAVIGRAAWTTLRMHPKIVSAVNVSGSTNGVATREAVAALFDLDEILVGEGYANTAKKGQTAVMSRVWGNSMALMYRNRMAGPQDGVTFGMTAQYGGRISGRIPEPKVGLKGSTRVRVGEQVREIIVAPAVGYLIEGIRS